MKDKQIARIRQKMDKQLGLNGGIFGDLTPQLASELKKASDYEDYRRVENERQLEAIKGVLAPYMFNEDVIVQGTTFNKKGEPRTVTLSHFDQMLKAANIFLNVLNMQHKLWHLYETAQSSNGAPQQPLTPLPDSKAIAAATVAELQRLAKREQLPEPRTVKATVVENES